MSHSASTALRSDSSADGGVQAAGGRSAPLIGRFRRADASEHACKLKGFTVSFEAPVVPAVGERIVAFVAPLGGIDGTVGDVSAGGFSVEVAQQGLADRAGVSVGRTARALRSVPATEPEPARVAKAERSIEIGLRNGRQLKVPEDIDPRTLAGLVAALDG